MIVKLIDFGLARRIPPEFPCSVTGNTAPEFTEESDDDGLGPDGLMTTPVGTPHFVAPEVLSSLPYGKEVDLFACGVIMYWLLSAKLPFEDPDPHRLAERIKNVDYNFANMVWDGVSDLAKDLVSRLLDRSPFSRPSASQALSHAWFYAERGKGGSRNAQQCNEPGNQIVVRKWTVDPAFPPSWQSAFGGDDHATTDRNGVKYALPSPVTPQSNRKSDHFRNGEE